MNDILDDREFHELMQAYRRAPIGGRSAVAEAYEAVKEFLRDNRDAIEDGSQPRG